MTAGGVAEAAVDALNQEAVDNYVGAVPGRDRRLICFFYRVGFAPPHGPRFGSLIEREIARSPIHDLQHQKQRARHRSYIAADTDARVSITTLETPGAFVSIARDVGPRANMLDRTQSSAQSTHDSLESGDRSIAVSAGQALEIHQKGEALLVVADKSSVLLQPS